MKKILIVEDEFIESRNLERIVVKAGYAVCGTAKSVPVALAIVEDERPDFVLIDIFLKGAQTGIDLARVLRGKGIPFLYISANSDPATLDAAKKTQPHGFLVKPFRERDVEVMLEIAMYQLQNGLEAMMRRQPELRKPLVPAPQPASRAATAIVGTDPALLQVMEHVRLVAPSSTSVLILGESGTGKERIAQSLHELSARSAHPFVKVNCAALPVNLIESILFGHEKGAFTDAVSRTTGKFEQAEKGTIFLDEVGELPIGVQVKLLRVLQEKEFERIGGKQTLRADVRIVAATNRDLEKEVGEGRFRLDLYYRLNVFPIHMPALRHRKGDIAALAQHFIELICRQENKPVFDLPAGLAGQLKAYHWPGNIRELENAVRRMVLLGPHHTDTSVYFGERTASPQTPTPQSVTDDVKSLQDYERDCILFALRKSGGKISGQNGAAQMLQLAPTTLESKMKKLGIRREDIYRVE